MWLNRWSVESDTIPRRKRCIFVIKLPESDDWRLDEHDFLAIYLIEEQRFARTMEADDQAGATSQAQPAASLDHDRAFTSKEEPLPSLETLLAAAGANNQVSDRIVVVVGVLDGGKMCSLPARGGIRDLTFEGQIDVEDLLHGNLRRPLEVSLNLWNKESDTIPLHKTCIFVIKLPMSDTGRLHERDFLAIYLIEEHRFARAMEMPGKSSGG